MTIEELKNRCAIEHGCQNWSIMCVEKGNDTSQSIFNNYIVQLVFDYEETLKSKRELTKEIDVILNGKNAAKQPSLCDVIGDIKKMKDQNDHLDSLINNPELDDFIEGIKRESAHQIEKWGIEQEETKFPHDYQLVLDYLKGKQVMAIWEKNPIKYRHHLITLAAVCFNAHRQVSKKGTIIYKYFELK